MQDRIGRMIDRLGPDLAGGGPEQREEFYRSPTDLLVRVPDGDARWLPRWARLRNRLIGAGLVLAEDWQAQLLCGPIRSFDQFFLGAVCGSVTVTGPAFRRRTTVPVWHQVRLACHEYPACHSVCRIVTVLMAGSPSGAARSARCKVVSDQVAVPSRSRSGARRNSRRMRSRSGSRYRGSGPPPWRRSRAASPAALKRAIKAATAWRDRRPARRAAAPKDSPPATASTACAWATRSARSLPDRHTRSSSSRSFADNGRNRWVDRRLMHMLRGGRFLPPSLQSLHCPASQQRDDFPRPGHNRVN